MAKGEMSLRPAREQGLSDGRAQVFIAREQSRGGEDEADESRGGIGAQGIARRGVEQLFHLFRELRVEAAVAVEQRRRDSVPGVPGEQLEIAQFEPDVPDSVVETHSVDEMTGEQRAVEPARAGPGDDVDIDVLVSGDGEDLPVNGALGDIPCRHRFRRILGTVGGTERGDFAARATHPHGEADTTTHAERKAEIMRTCGRIHDGHRCLPVKRSAIPEQGLLECVNDEWS
nr:hypothetical protein [Amycolatopsis japonica]